MFFLDLIMLSFSYTIPDHPQQMLSSKNSVSDSLNFKCLLSFSAVPKGTVTGIHDEFGDMLKS